MRVWVALLAGVLVALTVPAPAHATLPPTIGRWESSVIQVYSSAPTAWGVGKAVTHWNKNGVVTLVLVAQPCEECITVGEGVWPGLETALGAAGPILDAEASRTIVDCPILLNPIYLTSGQAHGVTAHEIGHCLGMEHHDKQRSLLASWGADYYDRPTRKDLRWVAQMYAR